MLKDHLDSPVTRRRLYSGPAAPHVDAFADWLSVNGYGGTTIPDCLRRLARWTDWMRDADIDSKDFPAAIEVYKKDLEVQGRLRYTNGVLHTSIAAASLFVRFLRDAGIVPCPAPSHSVFDRFPIIAEFRSWMAENRGLTQSSLDAYQYLVGEMIVALGDDPLRYSATSLRDFVYERGRPYGTHWNKCITRSIRAYLRFLVATGRCAMGIEYSIPSCASWKNSAAPRYIEPADLKLIIRKSKVKGRQGVRDRAVILLLARLGLRASDVAGLALSDIDWVNGRLAVMGKNRRQEWLPLTQEIGDALLCYIRVGRPELNDEHVFTSIKAPLRPLTRAAVGYIAGTAIRRAGVNAPSHGAHVFRHSAATSMLRRGATLAGVGAVLRHRSPATTNHYAKVDFALLTKIAQPWPGVSP